MYKIYLLAPTLLLSVLLCSCNSGSGNGQEKAKKEIAAAEKDFEKMAADKGMAEAFSYFADSNAIIKRGNDSLIHGKEGIMSFYRAARFKTASVKWSPDFVDASSAGDMGYTYGKYTWQSKDSTGKVNESSGIFHTVWKKQKDGSWKFVWD